MLATSTLPIIGDHIVFSRQIIRCLSCEQELDPVTSSRVLQNRGVKRVRHAGPGIGIQVTSTALCPSLHVCMRATGGTAGDRQVAAHGDRGMCHRVSVCALVSPVYPPHYSRRAQDLERYTRPPSPLSADMAPNSNRVPMHARCR